MLYTLQKSKHQILRKVLVLAKIYFKTIRGKPYFNWFSIAKIIHFLNLVVTFHALIHLLFEMTLETFTSDILPLKDKLYRYANSILKNDDLAKDVVQETMLKIWEKRKEVDSVKNLEAWCMTITRNFALSKYRLKDNQNSKLESGMAIAAITDSPYEKLEKEDVIYKIDTIVSKLPFKQKEVFQLRDIEGYSYSEICEITGYQLSDVKVCAFRARKVIKEALLKIYAYEKY